MLDEDGEISFPLVDRDPGRGCVYALEGRRSAEAQKLHNMSPRWIYIGQTRNLVKRLGSYRKPGPQQKTNIRVNRVLKLELNQGCQVRLFKGNDISFIADGCPDLGAYDTVARTLAEHAALYQLYFQKGAVYDVDFLNKGLDTIVDREFGDAPWL
ncbi:hypothetical protein ACFYUV_50985 [Nonomuraea sp. NPDC003560]|uniref:hypothetical protein n=1 Tax=Nonomuraea sp. NPDC003560 TaxID=3364341 RepID=UPI0036D1F415